LCSICGGRLLYRWLNLTPGRFLVREEVIRVPGLAPELAGFTIAQLSDLHAGSFLAGGDLEDVVACVNALAPDVIAITGDLITRHWEEALLILPDLARLESRYGSFAVFGNHDYRDRCEGRIAEAYAEQGIQFLRNDCRRVQVGSGSVALVGVEDLEDGKVVDPATARANVEPGDVEILLCHNPMGARALGRDGCAAILSGHTHGGQVDLPWLRTLGPQHPGLRIAFGATTLIVSRGLGVVGAPLRYRAPTEVVLVKLEPA
jgi:predicted MPP superfamily phosphohydrolase